MEVGLKALDKTCPCFRYVFSAWKLWDRFKSWFQLVYILDCLPDTCFEGKSFNFLCKCHILHTCRPRNLGIFTSTSSFNILNPNNCQSLLFLHFRSQIYLCMASATMLFAATILSLIFRYLYALF